MNIKYFFSKVWLIIVLITNTLISNSQIIDTTKEMSEIRRKFDLISNKKISNLKTATFALSESEEGFRDDYTILYQGKDIYMIRKFIIRDEGGPSSWEEFVTEVYLFDNKPFFYFRKELSFDSYINDLSLHKFLETRIYIKDSSVIRKLTKKVIKESNKIGEIQKVKADSVPNKVEGFSKEDFDNVLYFIEYSQDELKELFNLDQIKN
jgi:hypothetical protein